MAPVGDATATATANADPNNIYDAAAAAARYLCASGPMQTDDDMTRGFLSYNHSGFVRRVGAAVREELRRAAAATSRSVPRVNRSSIAITPELHDYVLAHSAPPDDVQRSLMEETAKLGPVSGMQIGPEQGAFMTILTQLVGVELAVEVGTFTGYSSLCIARGLAPGGRLHLLRRERGVDLDRPPPLGAGRRGRPHRPADRTGDRDAAGAAHGTDHRPRVHRRRQVRLPRLLRGARAARCDRTACCSSTTCCGPGGSSTPDATDDDTVAIRAFNDHVVADTRVDVVMLPIGDGLTVARKQLDAATIHHFELGSQ